MTPAVRVRGLQFAFDDERPLLDNVSFNVEAGEAAAITGLAGCGKSTLLRVLAGDLEPLSGEVAVDGEVRWLVPAVAITADEAAELTPLVGKDILRFANEPHPPGVTLSDEPDCALGAGPVRDLYGDALADLGDHGQAIVVASHIDDVVVLCEQRVALGEGGVVNRRDALGLYGREHRPERLGNRQYSGAEIAAALGGLAVVDVERGSWIVVPHVRPEILIGRAVSWTTVDVATRRRLDRRQPPTGDRTALGGTAAAPGTPSWLSWWPGKSRIRNEASEPATAQWTSYVPPDPLALPADACTELVARFGDRVASGGGRAAVFVTDDMAGSVKMALRTVLQAANSTWWQLDVSEAVALLCRYEAGGEAALHSDLWPTSCTRKLSATVQLSPADAYTGGDLDLLCYQGGFGSSRYLTAPRDQGSVTVFPSWVQHRVTPVESGERWALVAWQYGPPLR